MRSANSPANFRYVNTGGNANNNNATNTGNCLRPALADTHCSLPKETAP